MNVYVSNDVMINLIIIVNVVEKILNNLFYQTNMILTEKQLRIQERYWYPLAFPCLLLPQVIWTRQR